MQNIRRSVRSKADARAEKLTRGISPASTQSGERAGGERPIVPTLSKNCPEIGSTAEEPHEANVASRRGTELSSWLIVIAR